MKPESQSTPDMDITDELLVQDTSAASVTPVVCYHLFLFVWNITARISVFMELIESVSYFEKSLYQKFVFIGIITHRRRISISDETRESIHSRHGHHRRTTRPGYIGSFCHTRSMLSFILVRLKHHSPHLRIYGVNWVSVLLWKVTVPKVRVHRYHYPSTTDQHLRWNQRVNPLPTWAWPTNHDATHGERVGNEAARYSNDQWHAARHGNQGTTFTKKTANKAARYSNVYVIIHSYSFETSQPASPYLRS